MRVQRLMGRRTGETLAEAQGGVDVEVGTGGGLGGVGVQVGTGVGAGGVGRGVGIGGGVGGVGVQVGTSGGVGGVGVQVGTGVGAGGVGRGVGIGGGVGGVGVQVGTGGGVGGVGVQVGTGVGAGGVGRGVGIGGGVGGVGMGVGTGGGVGALGMGVGIGGGVGGVGIQMGTGGGVGGLGVQVGTGVGVGGVGRGVGIGGGVGSVGWGLGTGGGMAREAGMPGFNMGWGPGIGRGGVFRYANVGMGAGSYNGDLGTELGLNTGGQNVGVVVGTTDANGRRGSAAAQEIVEYPVDADERDGVGVSGGVGGGFGTSVSPAPTRSGAVFNLAAIQQRARQPYSAETINTGVNDEAPRRRRRDWRSSAFDEDGGDVLNAGLSQVLSLQWPNTGSGGDAQHVGTDEPGFEGEDDPEPEGADGGDGEEGGISVQTGFHRNRMGSRRGAGRGGRIGVGRGAGFAAGTAGGSGEVDGAGFGAGFVSGIGAGRGAGAGVRLRMGNQQRSVEDRPSNDDIVLSQNNQPTSTNRSPRKKSVALKQLKRELEYTAGQEGQWVSKAYPGLCERLLSNSQTLVGFFLLHYPQLWRTHFRLPSGTQPHLSCTPSPFSLIVTMPSHPCFSGWVLPAALPAAVALALYQTGHPVPSRAAQGGLARAVAGLMGADFLSAKLSTF
ncbi:unnamed protein product [Closterium sp. Naga37s-1]|nr:unnamed protein product [Closterium sp. Naga37s-1]